MGAGGGDLGIPCSTPEMWILISTYRRRKRCLLKLPTWKDTACSLRMFTSCQFSSSSHVLFSFIPVLLSHSQTRSFLHPSTVQHSVWPSFFSFLCLLKDCQFGPLLRACSAVAVLSFSTPALKEKKKQANQKASESASKRACNRRYFLPFSQSRLIDNH